MDTATLEALVITERLRVPLPEPGAEAGESGEAAARQLDAALMSTGFKCSQRLLAGMSALPAATVFDLGVRVLAAVRPLIGDHVRHNPYFIHFPGGVPDTLEFWAGLLRQTLLDPVAAEGGAPPPGPLNLLELHGYGTYRHSYADLLAAHAELVPLAGDRVTLLDAAESLEEEAGALYLSLAESEVPLAAEKLDTLRELAAHCIDGPHPRTLPVRENRAAVNEARLRAGRPLLVDTVTDVLRLACACSGGDVSLAAPTRLRSFRRSERRVLLRALDRMVGEAPAKLGDVARHRERWKRLGERLHPHDHPGLAEAAKVFAVARGERRAPTMDARVEQELRARRPAQAARLLSAAPGALLRRVDHLLRTAGPQDGAQVLDAVAGAVPGASGRVLLSLREHLDNRTAPAQAGRIFINRLGGAWTTEDTRPPMTEATLARLRALIDTEIAARLPEPGELIVDPDVLDVALPLSGKAVAPGHGVLPRGSVSPVAGELLRFFVYWQQALQRTDYDLSALMLDADYRNPEHISWTQYRTGFAEYSGDLTEAPDGASEFIDVRLGAVPQSIVIPQVNIYAGEGFDTAEEAFFGFMTRDAVQEGRPFEPRTVRMKSDLRGAGRVAVPLAFLRDAEGGWRAKWLHVYLNGSPSFNMVEGNRVTTARLVRSIVEREYLRVGYVVELLRAKEHRDDRVTYIGLQAPEELPEGARAYTLNTLHELIPA